LIGYYYHEEYTDLFCSLVYYSKDEGVTVERKSSTIDDMKPHNLITGVELEEFKADKVNVHKYSRSELVNIMTSDFGEGVDI
jgi:hypothetical protein